MNPNGIAAAACAEAEPLVSVIIPTMASAARAELLRRAVQSIRGSSARPVRIITVVNGARFDPGVCDWLQSQPDVQFVYSETPSAPAAILRGRELVETEFFSALDDDDEYLPGSTDQKLAVLRSDPRIDLVVGNYFQNRGDSETLRYNRLADVVANPLEVLMDFNWLASGNALFRSSSVDVPYFQNYHAYAEWTLVAFRLAMDRKKVGVVDIPVFRVYEGTAGSLSKSSAYFQAYIPLFQRMLALDPPPHIASMIRRKLGAAYHDASVAALNEGQRLRALTHHWRSLTHAGGLRYLSYTRHLIQ